MPASVIMGNHGHALTVTKAEAMAAADKTYDIKGTAMHTHTVVITVAQFAMMLAGTPVAVTTKVPDPNTLSAKGANVRV